MPTPRPLSTETTRAIRQIAADAATNNRQDPHLRAELISHLTDKVHAYLSGEETLTEADALVLARTHFGSPAVVSRLLRQARPKKSIPWPPAFRNNLAAAIVCTVLALALTYALTLLVYIPLIVVPIADEVVRTQGQMSMVPIIVVGALAALTAPPLLWLLLRKTRTLPFHRFPWLSTLIALAAAIAVQASAAWLFSKSQPELYYAFVPSDALIFGDLLPMLRDHSYLGSISRIASVGVLLTLFLRRTLPRQPRTRELLSAMSAFLVATTLLRIAAAISRETLRNSDMNLPHYIAETLMFIAIYEGTLLLATLTFLLARNRSSPHASPPPPQFA